MFDFDSMDITEEYSGIEDSSILPHGSPVRMTVSGRTGEIVDHDPNDTVLPYKIQFHDDETPQSAWVKKDAFAVVSPLLGHKQDPTSTGALPVETPDAFPNDVDDASNTASMDANSAEGVSFPAAQEPTMEEQHVPPAAVPAAEVPESSSSGVLLAAVTEEPEASAEESKKVDRAEPDATRAEEDASVQARWRHEEDASAAQQRQEIASATEQSEREPELCEPAPEASAPPAAASVSTTSHPSASSSAVVDKDREQATPTTAATAPVTPESTTSSTVASRKDSLSSEGTMLPRAMDNVGIYREALLRLNDQLSDFPLVKEVAERLRMPPLLVVVAGTASITAFCLWGFCGQLVSTFLGVMLPAFESFKCVEEFSNIKDPSEIYAKASSMQFWLIYWVVAGIFLSFEYTFYYVLIWVPMYYPTKLAVLLWLYMPQTRGANHVYHWLVAPTLRRNRRQIDAAIDNSTRHLKRGVTGALTNVSLGTLQAGAGGVAHLTRLSSAFVSHGVRRLSGGSSEEFVMTESRNSIKTD